MTSVKPTSLVLNINTPNYFQNSLNLISSKKSSEDSFATISTKKPKLIKSKPLVKGKALRPSYNKTKLKINSSLNKINNISNAKINNLTEIQAINPPKSFIQANDDNNNSERSKVTFSSKVQVFPVDENLPRKLLKPDYIFKQPGKSEKEQQSKNVKASGKPVISSLFKKNPVIPKIEKGDIKPSKQKVFSAQPFSELNISSKLISTVEKFGFTSMTTIQQMSIPMLLEGSDALIKSETGSGKTLAYALPLIHKLMEKEPKVQRKDGLYFLIVVPSRELAVQTYQLLEKLCKACVWIVPGYLIGGEKKKAEKARIRKGINILVATPGRLMDHINNTNSLDLNKVEYLVLDEADRMLDMGYENNIKSIMYALNESKSCELRQTSLLSATLTSAVEKLAGMSLRSPKVIDSTTDDQTDEVYLTDDLLVTPENLEHFFMIVPMKVRLVSLAAFIIEKCKFSGEKKILVFMTTQDMVDYHTSLFAHVLSRIGRTSKSSLQKRAEKVLSGLNDDYIEDEEIDDDSEDDIHFMKLHGNMSQPERTAVFKSFHEAASGVLLCTDVASRGLDLPSVNWIVQYNPASNPADYVHRVGRTARASKAGSAIVFISPSESTYISMLETHGIEFNQTRVENVLKTLTRPELYDKDTEKVPFNMEIAATRFQDKFENVVEADNDMRNFAIQGYVSFIRSYAAIPKIAREYFCFKLLHLGHCAKSFALRDPPAVLGAKGSRGYQKSDNKKTKDRKRKRDSDGGGERLLIPRSNAISEFDAGIEYLDMKENKKKKSK